MGFLNPNSDLEVAVQHESWKECSRLFSQLQLLVNDAITLSNEWVNEDKRRGCNTNTEQRFEQWTAFFDRSADLASEIETWKISTQESVRSNSKIRKPVQELLKMMNFAVTGAQSILITISLWIVEPRTTPMPEKYRDWLGRININIYELNDQIIQVGKNPRWTLLKPLAPGADRLVTVTQKIQLNMAQIEAELISVLKSQN